MFATKALKYVARVRSGDEDFTDKFEFRRFRRDWRAEESRGGKLGRYEPVSPWHRDSEEGAVTSEPIPPLLPGAPDKAPFVSYLTEYLVAVDRFPELGLLYYRVAVMPLIIGNRMRMFDPVRVTPGQWCDIKGTTRPYRDHSGKAAVTVNWPAIDIEQR